jgi:hypothetical protein
MAGMHGATRNGLFPLAFAILSAASLGQAPRPAPPRPPSGGRPPIAELTPDTGRLPAARRYLPTAINEPLMSMTIQVVQEKPGSSVYRSRHFQFDSPVKIGAAAMKEICRAFESTHELVSKLPWGITPRPQDGPFFRAQLFRTRAEYLTAGAPEWSAGFYSPRDFTFRIPFDRIGIGSRGDAFYLVGGIDNDTITHEVTHQMMHEYLRFMPIWMIEGTAEYTSRLPYQSGRYNVAGAIEALKQMRRSFTKEDKRSPYQQSATPPKWVGAEDLWGYTTSITERRLLTDLGKDTPTSPPRRFIEARPYLDSSIAGLPDRYFSSHLLVFFFMHFDGDGKATRIKAYFDAIHEERKLWHAFSKSLPAHEAGMEKYRAAWEAFKSQPGVSDLGDGRVQYPPGLTPPTPPAAPQTPGGIDPTKVCAKHLGILLGGRSLAELDAEVRAAFAKAGSPLSPL